MALSPRLELKTTQTLVMTPQLQQAIKLLQMSNLDLSHYVEQEVEKNPLLEYEGGESGDSGETEWGEAAEDESETPAANTADATADSALAGDHDPSAGTNSPLDTDFDNVFDRDTVDVVGGAGYTAATGGGTGGYDSDNPLEASVSEGATLRDYVLEQFVVMAPTPQHSLIGHYLIDFINDSGYLTESVENVAERLNADTAMVEETLACIQSCDPAGVGARTVAECLALQLREKNRYDPAMAALLDHLDLVARQDYAALTKVCGVDRDDLSEMLAELRALNPKPGSTFGGEAIQPVVPDVFITQDREGGWQVELNSDTLPRVLVNSRYYTHVRAAATAKDEKSYISDCMHAANWLVKALDQRARTILKVSSEIVRLQDGFLRHGVSHLKPLNLRMVAEAIGMHESTVSRVTANKYMATPRGIFELKYFFSSAVGTADGEEGHASETVRHKIKTLIDEESPQKVLSDDKLVALLRQDGIDVARRTVAKYREAMGIPSSVQRRRQKRVLVP